MHYLDSFINFMMICRILDEITRGWGCEFVVQVLDENRLWLWNSEQHASGGQRLWMGPKEMVLLLQALWWRYSRTKKILTVKPLFLWLIWCPIFHPFLGKQYLRYGCRRKVDSKMVHKRFCNKSNMKPRGDMRDCNQKACPPPMYVFTWEAQHLWKCDLQ